mgnify:CR=1 FL=1
MIKIKLLTIGNLKEKYLTAMQEEYLKRLSNYAKVTIIEEKEEKSNDINESIINQILNKEGDRLLGKIDDNDYVVLLDLHGKQIDSLDFAKLIDNKMTNGYSSFAFVIGGSYGVSDSLRKRANTKLSLSLMTFTHQFTRIIILEQIYRAFKINNNEVYHK